MVCGGAQRGGVRRRGLSGARCGSFLRCAVKTRPISRRTREGSVMLSVKHVARQRCEEFGLRAEVPVEAGLLYL